MKRRAFIGAAGSAVILAGCLGSATTTAPVPDTPDQPVEILDHELNRIEGPFIRYEIVGTVVNHAEVELSSAKIEARLYDTKGVERGDPFGVVYDVPAGAEADFLISYNKVGQDDSWFDHYDIRVTYVESADHEVLYREEKSDVERYDDCVDGNEGVPSEERVDCWEAVFG